MASRSKNKRPWIDEEGKGSNKKLKEGGGSDEVYVVPDDFTSDLVDKVFSHLPVVSAARVSLVSSRYKNLWKNCKNMIFDKSVVGGVENLEVMRKVQLAMNWHEGRKIDKFSICIYPPCIRSLLDDWIEIAIAKNVEEIELDYSPSRVPSPLRRGFSKARSVRTLKLINVLLEKPWRMEPWDGMPHLRDLRLRNCDLLLFEAVFSCCLQLEYLEILKCRRVRLLCLPGSEHKKFTTLKIGGCEDLEEIQINAPTLKSFYYQGHVKRTVLQGIAPQLEKVFVSFIPATWIMYENLFMILVVPSATNLSVLTLNSTFIEVMCKVFRQWQLGASRVVFPNLTELHIYMETYNYQTIRNLGCILECFPCLDTLHIDLSCCQYEDTKFFGNVERNSVQGTDLQQIHCLKTIKIIGFKSSKYEHNLLEYLVNKSVALHTLALVTSQVSIRPDINPSILQHLRFNASAPSLKISVYDYNDDHSCIYPSHTKTWYLV